MGVTILKKKNPISPKSKARGTYFGSFKDNLEFILMSVPAFIQVLVFAYIPMFGIILAFKDYKFDTGILGSKWVGLRNFEFFFTSQDFWRITKNTVSLNIIFIITGTIAAVTVAILLFEIKKRIFVKTYQTIMILPHFLSWVVVSFMVYIVLHPQFGILNQMIQILGLEAIGWYSEPKYWPVILSFVNIWKGVGMSSIMYYAALMSIDTEFFEAANIDGASKWQEVKHIMLPNLVPLITILTILHIGGMFRADFGLFYNVTRNSSLLYSVTDVIDTYVFRAVYDTHDFVLPSAVGLYQSIVGFILIMLTNYIVRKIEKDNALF